MEKVKIYIAVHKREVAFGEILFFVALLSFGLGYVVRRQFNHAPIIIIEKCA